MYLCACMYAHAYLYEFYAKGCTRFTYIFKWQFLRIIWVLTKKNITGSNTSVFEPLRTQTTGLAI